MAFGCKSGQVWAVYSMTIDKKWQYLPIVTFFIFMVIGLYLFNQTLNSAINDRERERLKDLTEDVAFELQQDSALFLTEDNAHHGIHRYVSNMTQASTSIRIQVIDPDGRIIGDTSLTELEVSGVISHSNRLYFKQAIEQGVGYDVEFSPVTSTDRMYYSQLVELNGENVVVALSMPMYYLKDLTFDLMAILTTLFLLCLVFLVGTTYYSNKQFVRYIQQENAKQDARNLQRTYQIELLQRLTNMLAACTNFKEAQLIVEDILPRILGKVAGSVSLMKSSRNQLEIRLEWGGSWPAKKSFSSDECWALRKGRVHQSVDEFNCLSCEHMADVGDNQTICIPLTAHGNTIGIMHLYFGDCEQQISSTTHKLVYSVAEHLGLALANLGLQDKLRSQAFSDPLTGLYNRRFFEQCLEGHVNSSSTSFESLSLVMLDLDYFKRFNDNYGHDAGDFVLKEVGALLKQSVSNEQVACRIGGEEFAIILPSTELEQAGQFAQSICNSVRSMHLNYKGLSLGQLGVSVGIASYPKHTKHLESLIKYADQALYQAKEQGRNRVILYQHDGESRDNHGVVEFEEKRKT